MKFNLRFGGIRIATDVGSSNTHVDNQDITLMPDQSELDSRYFVDSSIYNCPFCNRRHVSYKLDSAVKFNWDDSKVCWAYFVTCQSCDKTSMHLSFSAVHGVGGGYWFKSESDLDDAMFYSVPTSFFSLDSRVPREIRELLTEAEGCLKSNFLTGASACARKIVYELCSSQGASGGNYDERVRSLKSKLTHVLPEYFDTLLTIQKITSTKVHEESYDGWHARHLRVILAALTEVLEEIFVVPAIRQERRAAILSLRDELVQPKGDQLVDATQEEVEVEADS